MLLHLKWSVDYTLKNLTRPTDGRTRPLKEMRHFITKFCCTIFILTLIAEKKPFSLDCGSCRQSAILVNLLSETGLTSYPDFMLYKLFDTLYVEKENNLTLPSWVDDKVTMVINSYWLNKLSPKQIWFPKSTKKLSHVHKMKSLYADNLSTYRILCN